MQSRMRYIDILLPSGVSTFLCSAAVVTTLFANSFDAIQNLLQIPEGSLGVGHTVLLGLSDFLNTIFGVARTNALVLAVFWAIVGLVVYMFVYGLMQAMNELNQDLAVERKYIWPKGADRKQPLVGFLERMAFRAAVSIITLVYVVKFAGFMLGSGIHSALPFDILAAHTWTRFVVLALLLWVMWHILVVLLRLAILKRRLIGDS